VLQARETEGGVASTLLRSDGSGQEFLMIPTHNSPQIRSTDILGEPKLHKITMKGGEVFKFATRVVAESIQEVVDRAGIEIEDVGLIVPHQANERILRSAARNLGIDVSKFMTNLEHVGNTSAASIPIALCEAIEQNRINEGDYIVFVGFGGGLTWAAAVIQWGVGEEAIDHVKERRRQASYAFVRIRTRFRRFQRLFGRLFSFVFGNDDPYQD
jgi:3-oxoacyl-[acyl-carrier-protein] synthase III